jgi:hypothetical protein
MPATRRSRLPADALVPGGAQGGAGRIWIPWLLAPVFLLAPIAGCALAGRVRQNAIVAPPSPPPTPPTVSFEGAAAGPPTTFAPVVPAVPVVPPTAN